jgi:hypothetical protein
VGKLRALLSKNIAINQIWSAKRGGGRLLGWVVVETLTKSLYYHGEILISIDRVFDASVVPGTCAGRFLDLKGLINKFLLTGKDPPRTRFHLADAGGDLGPTLTRYVATATSSPQAKMTAIFCRSREAVRLNDLGKKPGAEEKSRRRNPVQR